MCQVTWVVGWSVAVWRCVLLLTGTCRYVIESDGDDLPFACFICRWGWLPTLLPSQQLLLMRAAA